MTHPTSSTPPAAAPWRKPADALPAELFHRIARNRLLVLWVGAVGATVGVAITIVVCTVALTNDSKLGPTLAMTSLFFNSLLIAPSIHLVQYARAIRDAERSPGSESLAKLLQRQLRFWRFIGITMIVWIVLIVLVISRALLEAWV